MSEAITLQSIDSVLRAKNDGEGNLTEPMLFLQHPPTQADIDRLDQQGWDNVLVCVDDAGISINPLVVDLYEDNNYFQSIYIRGIGQWTITNVDESVIQLVSSTGQRAGDGDARIDISSAITPSLETQGEYNTAFTILIADAAGTFQQVIVYVTVNIPLKVNDTTTGNTLTVNLNAGNNYTVPLTVLRDRDWHLEMDNVNTDVIHVSPVSGIGSPPDFTSEIIVTKSPMLATATPPTQTFYVVSFDQRVQVNVTTTLTVTGEFVDPRFEEDEEGVTGTANEPIYIYL